MRISTRWLVATAMVVMMLMLSAAPAGAVGPNLITNGDFESGNTGFSTEYTYLDPANTGGWTLGPPYMYTIGTNPGLYHSAWLPGFADHSTVGDKMMIVNGTSSEAGAPNKLVWGQEVDLPECDTTSSAPLYAGQSMLVGEVLVKSVDGKVCVKFVLNEAAISAGWLITETHVAVADGSAGIPQKNGNPIPGQFPAGESIDPGVTETDWYCLDRGAGWTDPLAVAAHAVVEREDCVVNATAPYGPGEVIDTVQGLRYDNTAVKAIRSNPAAALVFEGTKLETDFYSLGFGPGDAVDDAYLVVRFDTPVMNGSGPDLRIVEDTWGLPYPVESCAVYGSQDGTTWTYLGSANNQTPLPDGVHTFTDFDFDLGPLASASYIKVQDTSIRADFAALYPSQGATLDGFDVNAIVSLQDNKTCTTYSETAWGGCCDFPGKNWANFICYTPKVCTHDYVLEFYGASSYPAAPAQLQVTINGVVVPPTLELNATPGSWVKYSATWDAGAANSALIQVRDLRYTYSGDDFVIDDFFFAKQ